jgi:aspartyl-tRNA(Asn)/glutamyl-tRNA(Gln) amidotransferase subunit A
MAGDDPSDPGSAPVPVTPPGRPADPAGLRVALPRQWLAVPTDTAIRDAFAQAMDRLAGLGAMVEEVDAPLLDPPGEMMAVFGPQMIAVHRQWFTAHPDRYGPETRDRIAGWGEVANDDHVAGLRWQAALRHQAARLLSRYDVLATPMVPATRKVIGEDRMAVAGESHQYRAVLATFSSLVNATGFPALALPLAAAGDPPPSLQLVGPPWSEHRLLEAGAALEEAGIAAFRPPPRW